MVQRFRPGAGTSDLANVERYLGQPLPDELRMWWRWHDGAMAEPHERLSRVSLGPSFNFLGTNRAIEFSQQMRKMAFEIDPDDPNSGWASNWVAISSTGPVACNAGIDLGGQAPVLDVDYHHTSEPGRAVAISLGEMVRWWIEALESGAWLYDREADSWKRRDELVPRERELTGLV